jgi:hypothetical protein
MPYDSLDPEIEELLAAHTQAIQTEARREAIVSYKKANASHENAIRINELVRMDTRRHYGKGYQDTLDELNDYKDARLTELTNRRDGE